MTRCMGIWRMEVFKVVFLVDNVDISFGVDSSIQNAADELSAISKVGRTSVASKYLIKCIEKLLDSLIFDGGFVGGDFGSVREMPWVDGVITLLSLNDNINVNLNEAPVQLSDVGIVGIIESFDGLFEGVYVANTVMSCFKLRSDWRRDRRLASLSERVMMLSRWGL